MAMGDDGRGKSVRPASHSRGQPYLFATEGSLDMTHAYFKRLKLHKSTRFGEGTMELRVCEEITKLHIYLGI